MSSRAGEPLHDRDEPRQLSENEIDAHEQVWAEHSVQKDQRLGSLGQGASLRGSGASGQKKLKTKPASSRQVEVAEANRRD